MECFACNNICHHDAKFCLNCGHDLGNSPIAQPMQSSPSASRSTNSYPHSWSLIKWQDMKAKKNKNSLLLIGFILLALFATWFMTGTSSTGLIVAVVACAWTVWLEQRVSQKNYYALPHARDEEGEHRCIFCGGRGIFHKGVYNSSTVHSNCSKCQKRLFTDLM